MNGRNYVKLQTTKKKSGISDNFTKVGTPKNKKLHKSRRRRLKDRKAKVPKSSTTSTDTDKSDSFSVTIEEPKTVTPTQILKRVTDKPISVNVNLTSKKRKKIVNVSRGGQLSKSEGASPPIILTKKRSVSPTNGKHLKTKLIKPSPPPGFQTRFQTELQSKPENEIPPGFANSKVLDKVTKTQNNNSKLNEEYNENCDAFMKMLDGIDTTNIFESIVPYQSLTPEIPNEINLGIFEHSIWNEARNGNDNIDDGWDKVLNKDDNQVCNPYSREVYYSNPSIMF